MRAYRALDLIAKLALFALLGYGLVSPDLVGNKAHASTGRLVLYPIAVLVLPIGWLIWSRVGAARRLRRPRFPWAGDLLITLPWLLDTVGNRFGLFESIGWWDKMMHGLNWLLLTAGVLVIWRPGRRIGAGVVIMVALGFGATAALVWELLEYFSFNRFSNIPVAIYADTLGDLSFGTLGSLLAGLVVVLVRAGRAGRAARGGEGGTGGAGEVPGDVRTTSADAVV